MSDKIEYWGERDDEVLLHDNKDDAIRDILESYSPEGYKPIDFPEKITICGFKRVDVDYSSIRPPVRLLEYVIDTLDEEYGDPNECELSEFTPAMLEAQRVFLSVIEKEYKPYRCEVAVTEEIDVQAWLKNNPDF